MNKKIYAIILSIFFTILISFMMFFYSSYQTEKKRNTAKVFFDYQIKQLHKNIEDQLSSSMALAVLLGQNDRIQSCFLDKNRTKCIDNVNDIVSNLSTVLMYKNTKIHLHTNKLKSYLRSWDPENFGDNLSSFRHSLHKVNNTQKPVTGIESGVAGTLIRAVSTVTRDNKKLGSIEVLLDFEHIINFFKDQGIDIIVLLDKDKVHTHKTIKTDKLLKEYYIANIKNTNLNVIEILKDIKLKKDDFFTHKSHYFALSPMVDIHLNRIGFFVLHINTNNKERSILKEHIILNSLF